MGVNALIPDRLSDGQVAIRRLRRADAEAVVAAVRESAAELPALMPDLTPDLTVQAIAGWIDASEAWWEDGSGYNFAIVDAGDETFLGRCGLSNIHHRHRFANPFYWVRSIQDPA